MNKILLSNLDFPEGPAVGKNGEIWFVELHGGNVCRHIPGSDTRYFHIEDGKPNGIAVDSKGEIWFCDAGNDCVSVLSPSNGKVRTVCAEIGGEKLAHPNDLAFDWEFAFYLPRGIAHFSDRICLRALERRR